MTTIYLIRHAEAEGNVYRRLHGQYDSMLTPNGKRQAEALGRRFEDVQLHACYASDLTRACQTAQVLCKSHRLRLRREAGFREIDCGVWEDQCFGTLEHFEPQQMHQFNHDPWSWHVPESETFDQATDRFLRALRQVAENHTDQIVAVVAHGAVLRAVQARLFFGRENVERTGHCDNTGVSKLCWDGELFTLDYLNDNSHLDASLSTLARQSWWRSRGGTASRDYNLWLETAQDEGQHYLDLRLQNWRQRCGILTWADEGRVQRQMSQILAASPSSLYYGCLEDTLVGALLLEPDNDLDYGIIHYLGVLPERQNRGFAVQLLGQAVSHYRSRGKTKLRVLIATGDYAAAHFFEKNGFKPRKHGSGGQWYEMSIALPRV